MPKYDNYMTRYIWALCTLLVLSCKEKGLTTTQAEKEKIIEVVTQETLAYMEKDFQKWASYWDQSDEVLRLDISNSGFSQTRGWEKNGGHLKAFFKENPESITSTFENTNYLIFCDNNLAWVAFDQEWTSKEGIKSYAKATITLVKKDDDWKIISYTAIQYEPNQGQGNTLDRL